MMTLPSVRNETNDQVASGRISAQLLPSGRTVALTIEGDREELEIRAPGGEVEVRIALTEDGPLIRLSGGRLAIESADAVSVRCRTFEVEATEAIDLRSAGDLHANCREVRVKAERTIHLDGATIRLNCEPAS